MTTKEILKWRLTKLPTAEEVVKLLNEKLITKEEAREILFSTEKEEERDEASLKAEIKFLRELVQKLSNNQATRIVEVIKEVEKPYYRWDWHKPYMYYCDSSSGVQMLSGTGSTSLLATSGTSSFDNAVNCAFTNVKTF